MASRLDVGIPAPTEAEQRLYNLLLADLEQNMHKELSSQGLGAALVKAKLAFQLEKAGQLIHLYHLAKPAFDVAIQRADELHLEMLKDMLAFSNEMSEADLLVLEDKAAEWNDICKPTLLAALDRVASFWYKTGQCVDTVHARIYIDYFAKNIARIRAERRRRGNNDSGAQLGEAGDQRLAEIAALLTKLVKNGERTAAAMEKLRL